MCLAIFEDIIFSFLLDSYKMELAVIIAVIHMSFGIVMKGVNALYFKNWIPFVCEFVP